MIVNNSMFADYVDRTYSIQLDIKNNTYTARFASHLGLHL
jgi:hypothetical protein